ncbi:hypothetical protein J1605_021184 [Eschrichtius robustus]|uniref:Uncharacterized protein n=1 Tax=Eschrichtius robustus TaxID=9764 RepID=A0AB34HGA3_ESCRO|nr:hypothetical protein J1605_021184 [Eschrichtius robustus]
MQNDAREFVDLYLPQKYSASNRIIGAKDHASVQVNLAEVNKGFCKGESWSGALMHHRRWKALWGQPGAGLLRSRLDEAVQCPAVADPRLAPGPILNGRPPPGSQCALTQGPRAQHCADREPHSPRRHATPTRLPAPVASANCTCPRGGGSASSEGFALPVHRPRHTPTPRPDSSQGLAAAVPLPSARSCEAGSLLAG